MGIFNRYNAPLHVHCYSLIDEIISSHLKRFSDSESVLGDDVKMNLTWMMQDFLHIPLLFKPKRGLNTPLSVGCQTEKRE